MPRLDLRPEEDLNTVEELPQLLGDSPSDYEAVSLKGCLIHLDLLDVDEEEAMEEDAWTNLVSTAVFEENKEPSAFETISKKGPTVLYEVRLEPDEFAEKMERLAKDGAFGLGGYEVRMAGPDSLEKLWTRASYRSSDAERYDDLPRQRPCWLYRVGRKYRDLSWKGEKLSDKSFPGPFHRLDEDPPAANLFDAVKRHTFLDARDGFRGRLMIYQPLYEYRIQDHDYDRGRGELVVRLDGKTDINSETGLSLQLIGGLSTTDSGPRIQEQVTSATETVELSSVPRQTVVSLRHEDYGIVDFRRLQGSRGSNPFIQKASDLAQQDPLMAAPIARMGLLRHFRRMCEDVGVVWKEDEDVRDLLHKLTEKGVISGTQSGLIKNYWIETLGAATHLQRSEVTEKEVSSVVDHIAQWTRSDDMTGTVGFGDEVQFL